MLSEQIADFVRRPEAEGGDTFERLVRDAFAFHYEESPPLRRLAEAAGVSPGGPVDWRQVPMVPTLAFKTQTHGDRRGAGGVP